MTTKPEAGNITINIPSDTWDSLISRWSQLGFKSPEACNDFVMGQLINAAMGVCAEYIRKWNNLDLRFFGVCNEEFYEDDEEDEE